MEFGVSYFGNRILKHVKTDMADIKQKGFSSVLHTFSEFDLKFNPLLMKEIISATKGEGLNVVCNPWGVGNVFGGEPFSEFVAANFNDATQVLDDGSRIPMACPNSPKFISFMENWINVVAEAGADTLFWDEPHFHTHGFLGSIPERWGCRCEYCQTDFENMFEKPMPLLETEEVKKFKKISLIKFIDRLSERAASLKMKNILYFTANIPEEKIKTEWSDFFYLKHINTFATGPYWHWDNKPVAFVRDFSNKFVELTNLFNANSQIWIQGFRINSGREKEVFTALNHAVNSGTGSIFIWGYEGAAQEGWVACSNPLLVWKNICDFIKTMT